MQTETSFLHKQWQSAPVVEKQEALLRRLLVRRGLDTNAKIQDYLFPKLKDLHNPYGMDGMERAVSRVFQGIADKDRIIVYGDFDTDGITSTVILVSALQEFGAEVSYRIPDRGRDSHGLKNYLIDEMAEKQVKLIITCDCGINDASAVAYAKSLGIEVIITDHHDPDPARFPVEAVAVVNPSLAHCSYPDEHLSGSGVAFKLVTALAERFFCTVQARDQFLHKFLEINALGVIADCVPLKGENRILVKHGLDNIKTTKWNGLKQLLKFSAIDFRGVNEETVGFHIAPRLNAASRVGDVMTAVRLFLGASHKHAQLVKDLEALNDYRRELTQQAFQECAEQVVQGRRFQIFVHSDWIPGVLGLIAGRYAESLNVPVIVVRLNDDGMVSASCRAPKGYSIIEALRSCEYLIGQYGGHDGAAGFSMKAEELSSFETFMTTYFEAYEAPDLSTSIEAFLCPRLLNFEVLDFLKDLSPFGVGNPIPLFGFEKVVLRDVQQIGTGKNHLRVNGEKNETSLDFIGFFLGDLFDRLSVGQVVDVLFTMGENYWRGQRRLQLRLVDVRDSD